MKKADMPKAVFGVAFLLFAVCAAAQSPAPPASELPSDAAVEHLVQSAATAFMKNPAEVGISIGVIDHGRPHRFNYGEIAPGSGMIPTSDTLYEIGSISKSFTALLLAHAVAEHKMGMNDDIRLYLKGSYPNLQYTDGQPVRVVYLASHIAQFPTTTSKPQDSSFVATDFEQELHAIKLDNLQPYHYRYSNFGYQVLGVLLENAYGKTYSQLIRQYIAEPWNMPSTKVYTKTDGLIHGYDAQHHPMPENSPLYPGAGGLRSNVNDLLKYITQQIREEDPIVRSTHRLIYSPSDGANALPWSIGRTRDWAYYLREDGGTKGFRTFIAMYPDEQIGIVLLSNETDDQAGGRLYDLLNTIFNGLKYQHHP